MALAPLLKRRATDEVYESLRKAILSRVFLPGERLMADQLSEELGVSLTPIRHALQQLAVEGLVSIHPRSGTYVASISPDELEETFEIRLALELLAAQRAISRVTQKQLTRIRAILNRLAKPVEDENSLKQHEEANLDLHRALIDAAGSSRLLEMYESLNAHIQIARIHGAEGPSQEALKSRLAQEQREHEAIVEALVARSLPALEEALRGHIQRAQESLLEALRSREGKGPADQRAKRKKSQGVHEPHRQEN